MNLPSKLEPNFDPNSDIIRFKINDIISFLEEKFPQEEKNVLIDISPEKLRKLEIESPGVIIPIKPSSEKSLDSVVRDICEVPYRSKSKVRTEIESLLSSERAKMCDEILEKLDVTDVWTNEWKKRTAIELRDEISDLIINLRDQK